MKLVWIAEFGPPEALRIVDAPDPRPGPGTVVVAIETIGLGYMDTAARRGESYLASCPGFTPGYEVAGTVIDTGDGVDGAWCGKRVFAVLRQGGGCAERLELPADELIALPDRISCEDAVAAGLNALVAQGAIARLPIAEGAHVLVRGAGGGIGMMCVQYAALRGGTVVASTSSSDRGERLLALGAASIWNRLDDDLGGAAKFEVIVDTIIGPDLPGFFDRLATNGHYLFCGGVGGLPPADFGMKLVEHFHASPSVHAFSLNSATPERVAAEAAVLFDHMAAGRIKPVIDSVLPMTDIVAAHRRLDAGQAFGKIILRPDARP
ncbi:MULTISPECIES: zinc-dependent alcohol dehydrogenase family protein [unclassified Sphingomonas]|uniref:zinc-dependent alcohol dehydrogenase family protein n=1 Tax=unclassified Sphingomonas TaxID=196159 RepID=UPI0006F5A549|nr:MULTISPECIES: zinc-dependent alcohol dehydrogenase family protein [unclassified Sphingomonas]KQX19641.1 alcohol dehydrogenase [Sphingomonas sp. Root1294]KQY65842.1 alcohol dehydrogenase [Sphingomonas sp. Root50]KRB94851.1 alcohol dehydrogenase [Sphingomonas sp. Root720]